MKKSNKLQESGKTKKSDINNLCAADKSNKRPPHSKSTGTERTVSRSMKAWSAIALLPVAVYLVITRDAMVFLILLSVLIHELGHIAAAAICGRAVKSFSLGIGGMGLVTRSGSIGLGGELLILLSGAGANILAGAIMLLPGGFCFFSAANFMFAVFNLLPVGTLDGGEALFCILERAFLPEKAYAIRQSVSFVVLLLLWVISAFLLFYNYGNISLMITVATLFVANFKK